jgi:hypothetical protein
VVVFRGRSLRGAALLYAGRAILDQGQKRWERLTAEERSQLTRLLKLSRGRPSNLNAAERDDLSRLIRKANGGGEHGGGGPPDAAGRPR